jgi:hypothetical protein
MTATRKPVARRKLSKAAARTVLAWIDELVDEKARTFPDDASLARRVALACLVGRLECYLPAPEQGAKRNL